jgi:benzoyl-CoA reductase subunit C
VTEALARAKELYENRGQRVRELKNEGRKIIGYICCYPPAELITAAGCVPFRITGNLEPVTAADAYLETLMCPYVRNCFDMALKKKFDFLDGMIWPHTCDNIHKTYDIWKHNVPLPFFTFLDVPHMTDDSSIEFFSKEIALLKKGLEEFTGTPITEEGLKGAIAAHNENRALLRRLSALRKQDPPLVSGTEMTQIITAVMALPVDEANALLSGIIEEVQTRKDGPRTKPARLLVYGSEIDDVTFIKLVEDSGANVVIDDLCFGTRFYWDDVALDGDPLKDLADRYLGKIMCPRTYRRWPGTRQEDLDNRFGYIKSFAKDFDVKGAILYIVRYCDTFEFDVPDVRDYLQDAGIPCLVLEDDYSLTSIGGLKTRIEAFLEMISS